MLPILPGAPWLVAHRFMLGTNQPYKLTLNGQIHYCNYRDSIHSLLKAIAKVVEQDAHTKLSRILTMSELFIIQRFQYG
jgi:hypothetical protein